jgi:hypothetical protein
VPFRLDRKSLSSIEHRVGNPPGEPTSSIGGIGRSAVKTGFSRRKRAHQPDALARPHRAFTVSAMGSNRNSDSSRSSRDRVPARPP